MRKVAYVSLFLLAIGALIGGGVYASVYALQPPTATPPVLQPPAAPTNLDHGGKGLAWDDNSDNEDGFYIYKTVGEGAPERVATLPADTTSALRPAVSIDEACDGTTFTVVAFNAAGESSPSEGADIAVPICDPAPLPLAAPTNLRFEGNDLVWDDNSDNEGGFYIYKTVGDAAPEIVATLPTDTTSAPVPAVSKIEACDGTTFTVVAFNAGGESPSSEGADILGGICDHALTPPLPMLPPLGSGSASSSTFSWSLLAVAGVGLALVMVGAGKFVLGKGR